MLPIDPKKREEVKEMEKRKYLSDCKKAGLCPHCGRSVEYDHVPFRMGMGMGSYDRYTCEECGVIYYA